MLMAFLRLERMQMPELESLVHLLVWFQLFPVVLLSLMPISLIEPPRLECYLMEIFDSLTC